MAKSYPSPLKYKDYQSYLNALIEGAMMEGESLRAFSKRCGFASPNYLQQMAEGKRSLSIKSVGLIADALKLSASERKYLKLLVSKRRIAEKAKRSEVQDEINLLSIDENREKQKDRNFYSHWLNSVIHEMVRIPAIDLTPESLRQYLGSHVSLKDAEDALKLALRKGWIAREGDRFVQRPIEFIGFQDVRQIDVQRNHEHYLKLACHRLADPVELREFQGLTVAIPAEKLPEIKKQIRDFVDHLDRICSSYSEPDQVYRLQLAYIPVSKRIG